MFLTRKAGVSSFIVFLNKCDAVGNEEILQFMETDIRELLEKNGIPGDKVPVVRGSGLPALQGDEKWEAKILELTGFLDKSIPEPESATNPGSIDPHTRFQSQVYMLGKEEGGRQMPISKVCRPQFDFSTTDVTGTIELPNPVNQVMPGDNLEVGVSLDGPIAMRERSRFAIREDGRTVGVGCVTKITA
ncbi:MAG: hypothetical protein Q9225_001492 [Loekoesia sp. 1 TL-2023]